MYDPNSAIAKSMKTVLLAFVPDHRSQIDAHFAVILPELLRGMESAQWRTREASCGALADLLSGRAFEDVEMAFAELWQAVFHRLEDIKETVRTAAQGGARVLSSMSLRCCSFEANPVSGERALAAWLPLLQQSVQSGIAEVKAFSVAQLLKLCETAGCHLRPHLAGLIPTLLELASSAEPDELNYLQFHAEKLQMTPDALEAA